MKILNYPLEYKPTQYIACHLVSVLDIQILNKGPVIWVAVDDEEPLSDILIVMQLTAREWADITGTFVHISTTQDNGFVAHWFVESHEEEDEEDD